MAETIVVAPDSTVVPPIVRKKSLGALVPPKLFCTSLISVIDPFAVFVKVHSTVSLSSTLNVAVCPDRLNVLFVSPSSTQVISVRSHPAGTISSVVNGLSAGKTNF